MQNLPLPMWCLVMLDKASSPIHGQTFHLNQTFPVALLWHRFEVSSQHIPTALACQMDILSAHGQPCHGYNLSGLICRNRPLLSFKHDLYINPAQCDPADRSFVACSLTWTTAVFSTHEQPSQATSTISADGSPGTEPSSVFEHHDHITTSSQPYLAFSKSTKTKTTTACHSDLCPPVTSTIRGS